MMGRPVRFQLPSKRVTEIRVHGVGGTSPEDILDDPQTVQVSGDEMAGFFRRKREDSDDRHVEAYSWGGLTSRSAGRSLWLLLMPFMFVNVGGWMVEADTDPDPETRAKRQWHAEIQERAIRVMAVLMSVSFVAWIAAITVDVIAYQCGGRPGCREGHWWMGPLGNDLLQAHPGLRILIGVIPALALFALVDWSAKTARNNYEEYEPPTGSDVGDEAGDQANLDNPKFWYRPSLVRDLVWFHRSAVALAIAGATAHALSAFEIGTLATLLRWLGRGCLLGAAAFAVGTAFLRRNRTEYEETSPLLWKHWAGVVLAAVVFLGLALHVWLNSPDPDQAARVGTLAAFRRLPFALLFLEIGVALVALGAQLWWWAKHIEQWPMIANVGAGASILVGILLVAVPLNWVLWLLVVAALVATFLAVIVRSRTVLLWLIPAAITAVLIAFVPDVREHHFAIIVSEAIIVTVVAWILAMDRAWEPNAFRYGGMIVLPLMGAYLLAGTFAGAAFRVVDFLDKEGSATLPSSPTIDVLPPAYDWVAVAVATAVALTALAAFLLSRQTAYEVKRFDPPVPGFPQEGMPGTGTELTGPRRERASKSIRKSITLVRTSRSGDLLFTALVALATIVLLRGLVTSLATKHPEASFWHGALDSSFVPQSWLLTVSTWVLAGLPALAVLAFRRSTREESTRRRIGIVWDLGTFWPRRFHPFAPPSYAERSVPELQHRINDATVNNAGDVVPGKVALLGHSQGSVLSFAALASRSEEELAQVRFVTYGSPLMTFFRRFFPTYFSDAAFVDLASTLSEGAEETSPRWRNYHRWTDPIAAPIFTGGSNDPSTGVTAPASGSSGAPGEDQPLYDPWWWWDVPGQPVPYPLVHSNYLADPAMKNWVDALWPLDDSSPQLEDGAEPGP